MEDPQHRLEVAKRRHKRARDLPVLMSALEKNSALGSHVDVLDIEESVRLEEHVYSRFRQLRGAGTLSVADQLDERGFRLRAEEVLRPVLGRRLLVFLCHWGHVGALELTGRQLSDNVVALLALDGDSVTACTVELDYLVGFDIMSPTDQGAVFEVSSWALNPDSPPK